MREPHPFARFINILGRGKSLTRPLTIDEAREAMGMILDGQVLPEQLGAFLMLLRVKEETGEEIAGFVQAAQARFVRPADAPAVDLDWPSYAGKKRQLPWYILAALLVAGGGRRVLMHGLDGHTPGRVWSPDALRRLGAPVARDASEAAQHLQRSNFAYLPLTQFHPTLADLMGMKPVLGLRSAVNTLARALNPFGARASLVGVFHPGYMIVHRDADMLLDRGRTVIFRGDGGEAERRPNKPCEALIVQDGACVEERWPAFVDPSQPADEHMDLDRLAAVWRGDLSDAYGEAAVIGTTALALRALGEADDPQHARASAEALWQARDRARLAAVA
jgi:anthranilate phosphoribosyltransferase